MFKVYINNDQQKALPTDDIFYIVAKNGIFLHKKLDLLESTVKVNNVPFLNDIESYAKLNIAKIPINIFGKIVSFFREVYNTYESESMVILFYNKLKSKYMIFVPEQEVSKASVEANKKVSFNGYIPISTIHSHSDFSAFHSSIDTTDEENFDGIHFTVGNVNDPFVSIVSSIAINGNRFKVDPCEYVEGISLIEDKEDKENTERPFYIVNDTKVYFSKTPSICKPTRYNVEYFDFDMKWMDKVKPKEAKVLTFYQDPDLCLPLLGFPDTIEKSYHVKKKETDIFTEDGNEFKTFDEYILKNQSPPFKGLAPGFSPCDYCQFRHYIEKELEEVMGE